ncbi:MAG: hypothetical protein MJZ74_11065, partial [Muribaculaceae bacterium]|nr:hypothetical protein [Muribaculaceae bacterium]
MAKSITKFVAVAAIALAGNMGMNAQDVTAEMKAGVQQVVEKCMPENMMIGRLNVKDVRLNQDTVFVDLSENFGDIPFTVETIGKLKADVKTAMGAPFYNYNVEILIDGADIDNYFTNYETAYKRSHSPFITAVDPASHYKKALDGNIIALWPSHGWYFEPKLNRWEWQRARMFQTVEDMYTHSYVLPFLMRMLENAGAYVWDARERDTHNFGAVVDNDGGEA